MTIEIRRLEEMVSAGLASEKNHSAESIREMIANVRLLPWFTEIDEETAELLARKFEARLDIEMTIGAQLLAPDFLPWLPEAKVSIEPYYWERYRKLLIQKGLPTGVIATMDTVTDTIAGLLENPQKTGPWKRRGMVVGHVQSGKTANYSGVICKAADAGYRLIVIIAGIHNSLRNQTQMRIDEGFIGRDTAKSMKVNATDGFIGVSQFGTSRRPVSFTNSLRDFNKTTATQVGVSLDNLNEPAVLVIKKNASTLTNLIGWLTDHNSKRSNKTISAPMLLIDDEADNASINTAKDKGAVTRINSQIRQLLELFDRSCYVGYTATPFANIFIDPDTDSEMLGADLFPRDFIVSLDPPSNYVGATRIFTERNPDIIRTIDDNEDLLPVSHKKDHIVLALPGSLMKAIRSFIVARAIRLIRGHRTAHCSMLVNASWRTGVQERLKNEIVTRLREIQASVRVNGEKSASEALKDPEIRELHKVWQSEFSSAEPDWSRVQHLLNEAAAPVQVTTVNSGSSGTLNYTDHSTTGLSVIAVGGYSLSRGLTLEGLMVSYFLRNSMMYDTLMQMGRWFGYRDGYEELCRLWMTEAAEGWFEKITEAVEELRDELRIMGARNATPEQFGLRVRSDPETLIVTARNKMGSSKEIVLQIGLANSFIETAVLHGNQKVLAANREAAHRLAQDIGSTPDMATPRGRFHPKVAVTSITDFIRAFDNHEGSMLTKPEPVLSYISDRSDGELAEWDVLFTSLRDSDDPLMTTSELGFPVIRQSRTAGLNSKPNVIHVSDKQRVASRGVERTGVSEEAAIRAERDYKPKKPTEGSINYPDRIYREVRTRPLLVVHLLKIDGNLDKPGGTFAGLNETVVAWSISFPRTAMEERTVQYVVNTTWMKENMIDDASDEEPLDDAD